MTLYNRRTTRRKHYRSKTNRKKPVCYGKEHENDSHEFWWTFVFRYDTVCRILTSMGRKNKETKKEERLQSEVPDI